MKNNISNTSVSFGITDITKNIPKVLVIIMFGLIILSPSTAFDGVKKGLTMWLDIIFPGLFMAMIVTSCMLSLFPMNQASSYLYTALCGVLCGYPIGAILCGQLHKKFPDENFSAKIMAYCNISSPSFVLNYLLRSKCMQGEDRLILLLCIYLPVIEMLAFMFIFNYKSTQMSFAQASVSAAHASVPSTGIHHSKKALTKDFAAILDDAIWGAMENMLKLGGYIIAFSCILAYIMNIQIGNLSGDALNIFIYAKTIICGIVEITNGIALIDTLVAPELQKIIMILAVNAFGGISTIMQTIGMIKGSGLKIQKYIYHKIVFAAVTVANTIIMIYVLR